MSWVIEHNDGRVPPLYWNGREPRSKDGVGGIAYVLLEQAARFDSQEAALRAFRGDYRPTDSCCNAVEAQEASAT